jgi:uncharacterized membrane protein
MFSRQIPRIIFFSIVLIALSQCIIDYPLLPSRLASHFGASGLPNGWMTKQAFFIVYLVMICLATVIEFYAARSIGRSPSRINLPHKEYWLAPERRAETFSYFEKSFAWYGCLFLLIEVLAMGLAIQANLNPPPRLATGPILAMVFVFLTFNIAFVVQLIRRFSKPG